MERVDRYIESSEIEEAVKKLAKCKSPRADGIPNEFYQKFWKVIEVDLVWVIQSFFQDINMSRDLNRSLIVLMPKIVEPKRVRDFRPISLLAGIYKIVAKIFASRIRLLVPKLVHPNQTSFIHGRLIFDNCLSIWSGVEEGPRLGQYILLKIDFEKTYDRLE